MALLHPTLDLAKKRHLKEQGHIGYVVINDDSSTGVKRQRVKIRIPQVHRNVPDGELPWAQPQNTGKELHAGGGIGNVHVPPEGAQVWVYYENGDPHMPYYTYSPTIDEGHIQNELLEFDYPWRYGEIDRMGNLMETNTKPDKEYITWKHLSGSVFHLDKEGNIYIHAKKVLHLSAEEGIEIASDKYITNHAVEMNSIKGETVQINSSDPHVPVSDKARELSVPRRRPTPQNTKGLIKL